MLTQVIRHRHGFTRLNVRVESQERDQLADPFEAP